MYDRQQQNKSIQCLTQYLQYFKSYFPVMISLIECHVFSEKFNHQQLESITQKILNKKIEVKFTSSPFLVYVRQKNKSYIDRFYMRIIQFLQYRLNIFKANEVDTKISSSINAFINNLHRFFKQLTSNLKQGDKNQHSITIGDIFVQIEKLINKLIESVFNYLITINKKRNLIVDEIMFSKKIINEQILGPFSQILRAFQKENECEEISSDLSVWGHSKNHYENQDENYVFPQSRSRSEIGIQKLYSINSKSLRQSKMNNQYSYNQIQANKIYSSKIEMANGNLSIAQQNQIKRQKKDNYYKLISIMDIQDVQVYSKDYIMSELKTKNEKNQQMILKYLKLYQKKQKKHKRKQQLNINQETQPIDNLTKQLTINRSFSPELKSKSQINVSAQFDKITMIQNEQSYPKKLSEINLTKKENKLLFNEDQTYVNISNTLILVDQQKGPKSKSESIRQQIMKKSAFKQNSEIQTNKDSFIYKEKQKLYFQSLKNQLNFQASESKALPYLKSIKRQITQIEKLHKVNKVFSPNKIDPNIKDQKRTYRSLKKAMKEQISSGVTKQSKKKSATTQLLSLHEESQTNVQTMESLQGSSLYRRMPKRGKNINFMQIEQNLSQMTYSSNCPQKKPNSVYIQSESSIIVLPRIPSIKKHIHTQK